MNSRYRTREHMSTQSTLTREHVSTQDTLAREHVFGMQGRNLADSLSISL